MKRLIQFTLASFLLAVLVACGADSGDIEATSASFTVNPSQPGVGQLVNFDGSGSQSTEDIVSYQWDFGDGNSATGETVAYQYESAGLMNVTLTITDTEGNTATTSKSIPVGGDAVASFTTIPENLARDILVQLDGSGSSSNVGNIVSWDWQVDGQDAGSGEQITYFFEESGFVDITLTVEDEWGNSDTFTQSLEVAEELTTAGIVSGDLAGELQFYADDGASPGSTDWTFTDSSFTAVDSVPDLPIYAGTGSGEVYEVDASGNGSLFYDGHSDEISSIIVQPDNTIITGSRDGEVHKIAPDGTQEWSFSADDDVRDLDVDSNGDVYAAAGSTDNFTPYAYRIDGSNGSEVWMWDSGFGSSEGATAIAVNEVDGEVYVTNDSSFVYLSVLEQGDGSEFDDDESSLPYDFLPYHFETDSDGNLYAAGGSLSNGSGQGIGKYDVTDPSGIDLDTIWEYDGHSADVQDFHRFSGDDGTFVYSASSDNQVHKINNGDDPGTGIWTYEGHGDEVMGVTFQEGVAFQTLNLTQVRGNGTVLTNGFELKEGQSLAVEPGDTVTLEAVPDESWEFSSWSNNVSTPTAAQTQITIGEDPVDLEVTFDPLFELSLASKTGLGTVTANGQTLEEGSPLQFSEDEQVNLSASPEDGWKFRNWSNNVADSNSASTTVTMNFNKGITVEFGTVEELTLSEQNGLGTVNVNGDPLEPGQSREIFTGESATLEAVPDANWLFDGWSSNVDDPASATTSITVNEDEDLTVDFLPDGNVLTLTEQTGQGTVTANGQTLGVGPQEALVFDENATVSLDASAGVGHMFGSWSSNVDDPNSSSTQITMDSSKDISIDFPPQPVDLTVGTITGQGSVLVDGDPVPEGQSVTVDYGTTLSLQADPDSDWGFSAWSSNVDDPSSASTSILMDGDKTISITYLEEHELTLTTLEGNGTVTIDGQQVSEGDSFTYLDGQTAQLTADPNDAWSFGNWSSNVDNPLVTETSITMTQDEDLTVLFEMIAPPVYTAGLDGEVHNIQDEGFSQVGTAWEYMQNQNIEDVASMPEGGPIYAGDDQGNIHKIDENGNGSIWYDAQSDRINALETTRDGFVVSGSEDGTIHKIAPDGSTEWTFDTGENYVRTVKLDQAGNVYAGGGDAPSETNYDGVARRIDGDTGEEVWATTNLFDPAVSMAVDEENDRVYIVNEDFHDLEIMDRETGDILGAVFFVGPTPSLQMAGGGDIMMATGSMVRRAEVIIPDEGSSLTINYKWTYQGHEDDVNDLFVRPEQGTMFTASSDGDVHKLLYDNAGTDQIWTYTGHSDEVQAVSAPTVPDPILELTSFEGQGTVMVNGEEWTQGDFQVFEPNTIVSLNAIPDGEYQHGFWSLNVEDHQSPQTDIILTEDEELRVKFHIPLPDGTSVWSGSLDQGVHRTDDTGSSFTQQWQESIGSDITAVDAVAGGPIYAGDASGTIHKLDMGGNPQSWYSNQSDEITSLIIDGNGNVYSGSLDGTVHKIAPDGSQEWSFSAEDNVKDLDIDSSGDVYIASGGTSGAPWAQRVSGSDGSEVWTTDYGFGSAEGGTAIAVNDNDGVVYAANDSGDAYFGTMNQSDGSVITDDQDDGDGVPFNWLPTTFETDSEGNLYVAGSSISNGIGEGVGKYVVTDPGGIDFNTVWEYDGHGDDVHDIFLSSGGGDPHVYSASSDGEVHKIDDSQNPGTNIWSYTGHSDEVRGVAGPFVPQSGLTLTEVNGVGTVFVDGVEVSEGETVSADVGDLLDLTVQTPPTVVLDSWSSNVVDPSSPNTQVLMEDPAVNITATFVEQVADDSPIVSGSSDQEAHSIAQDDGSLDGTAWTYNTGTTVTATASAIDGTAFAGGNDGTIHKIESDGTGSLWYSNHSDTINALAVDFDGFVYSASSDGDVHKIAPDGTNEWTYSGGNSINDLSVLDNGDVVITSQGSLSEVIRLEGDSGNEDWATDFSFGPAGPLAVDEANGLVYIFKVGSFPDTQWFNLSDGTVVDSAFTSLYVNAAEVRNGEIIRALENGDVERGNVTGGGSSGEFIPEWTYSGHSDGVEDLSLIDHEGALVTASLDGEVHKLDDQEDSVANLWSYTGHGNSVGAVDAPSVPGSTLTLVEKNGDGQVFADGQELTVGDSIDPLLTEEIPLEAVPSSGFQFGSWSSNVEDPAASQTSIIIQGEEELSVTFSSLGTPPVFSGGNDQEGHGLSDEGTTASSNWTYSAGANVTAAAGQPNGTAYFGDASGDIHQVQDDGTGSVWYSGGPSSEVVALEVDGSGNVIAAYGSAGEVHKIDSSGNNVWSYTDPGTVNDMDLIEGNGDVVITWDNDDVERLDGGDGTSLWTSTVGFGPAGPISVDEANSLVYTINNSDFPDIYWFDLGDGTYIDDVLASEGDPVPTALEIRGSDLIRARETGVVHRGDPTQLTSGTPDWAYTNHGGEVTDLALTDTGTTAVITASLDGEVHKIDDQGTSVSNIWTYTGHSSGVNAVAAPTSGGSQSIEDENGGGLAGGSEGSSGGTGGSSGSSDLQAETNTVTFTLKDGQGTVYVDGQEINEADSVQVPAEQHVTITAEAADGWQFGEWTSGNVVHTNLSQTRISAPEDHDLSVTFREEFQLTRIDHPESLASGKVRVNGQLLDIGDSLTFADGDQVLLQAAPDENNVFASWMGDLSTTFDQKHVSITINQDMDVAAVFHPKVYEVTLSAVTGQGSVTANGNNFTPGDTLQVFTGETVNLQALPDSGWRFASWSGGLSDSNVTLTVEEDLNLTVTFEEIQEHLITGSNSDFLVQSMDRDGNSNWQETLSAPVRDTVVDDQGNVYLAIGGENSLDREVQKRNSAGTVQWTHEVDGSTVNAVSVDANGNVYAGTENGNLDRLASDGTHEWTWSGNDPINDLAVDRWGHVFVATDGVFAGESLVKVNADSGNTDWVYGGLTDIVNSVATHPAGYVYAGGTAQEVHKIHRDGSSLWTYSTNSEITSIAATADRVVIGDSTGTIHSLTSEGTADWTNDSLSTGVASLALDVAGDLYAGTADGRVRKLDSKATVRWTNTGHGGAVLATAVEPGTAGAGFRTWEGHSWTRFANTPERTGESRDLNAPFDVRTVFSGPQGKVTSSPVIGDLNDDNAGELVTGVRGDSDDNAVDPGVFAAEKDGSEMNQLWFHETSADVTSSPAIADVDADGTPDVIAGTGKRQAEGSHPVFALNPSDGSRKWTFSTDNGPVTTSPVFVSGDPGRVIVGSGDGTLYAIDGTDGSEIWSLDVGSGAVVTPALGDVTGDGTKEIIAATREDGGLYAVRPSGAVVWSTDRRVSPGSAPVIGDLIAGDYSREIAVGTLEGRLLLLDGRDGTLHWSKEIGATVEGSPVVSDVLGDETPEMIVGSSDGMLRVFESNSDVAWTHSPGDSDRRGVRSSPIVVRGTVETDPAVFYAASGTLYQLEAETGVETASWSAGTGTTSVTSPIVGDLTGNLVLEGVWLTEDGDIHLFQQNN